MKNLGKIGAYIIAGIMVAVFALGVVLSFVPMTIGHKDYESFLGSLNLSQELGEGITAEYTITSDSTDKEISSSIKKMNTIISDYGFKSVNIYKKGSDKIRVDISSTVLETEKSSAESFLKILAGGKLEIKNKNDASATSDNAIIIDGAKHIENITKITSRGTTSTVSGIKIDFTKEGKELYSSAAGSKLYMFVGGKAWPSDNSGNEIQANTDPSSTSMYLMFNSQEVVDSYYYILNVGTLSITMDAENVQIASFSSSTSTVSKLVLFILILLVEVAVIVILSLKYKMLALPGLLSSILASMVLLFLMQAMNWVTLGRASLVTLLLMEVLNFVIIDKQCSQIKAEYNLGKSLETAVDDGFRKTFKVNFVSLFALLIIGVTLSAVMGTEVRAIGTIIAVWAVLTALALLLLSKALVGVLQVIFPMHAKIFGLKEREEK